MIDMNNELWTCFNQLEQVENRLLELYKRDRRELDNLKDAWSDHEVILSKIESLRCVK